ncbi:response regulator [Pelagicoccus enzymogenes]|uniref:hybrid sensor histidine kinase/response regulator transcription factor n=1 Tax=Pelagicoccus enzymogenes TaxID=2773457 RepID=UPI0028103907|nr:response regulator [Pelagicoccus enzymogenes]MDQ8201185.1 response regulator [Pelagicoccus enzymogenes]
MVDPDREDLIYGYEDYERTRSLAGLAQAGLYADYMEIAEDGAGGLWFCVSRRMGCHKGGNWEVYEIEDVPVPSSYPYLSILPDGRLLMGGYQLIPQIVDMSEKHWQRFYDLNFQFEDESGAKWFLEVDRRVVSFFEGKWTIYDKGELIDVPNRLLIGQDGYIWASGSHQGQAAVSLLENGEWKMFVYPDIGTTFSHLGAIETREGMFIFGGGTPEIELGEAVGGAAVFQELGGELSGRHFPPPTFPRRTANIAELENEGLLFGSGRIFRGFSNDVFAAKSLDLINNQWIDHMIVDQKDDLWIACMGVGVYRVSGTSRELHGRNEGLDTRGVIYLLEGTDGESVLALSDEGFYRFDGSRWNRFGFEFDLPLRRENHTVFSDREGGIWINFASRAWYLEREPIRDGENRFQTIRYLPETNPPQTYADLTSERFPEGSQIQVGFTGVDLWDQTPGRDLVYSWSENGEEWSDYSALASVTLSGNRSGDRSVWVRARDLAGNVDPTPATVHFTVVPPVWKRAWFVALALLAVVAFFVLIAVVFKYRVRAALAIEEFKLDFFTNISHELRNPLAVIVSPVELLLESDLDSRARDKLRVVLRNARRMQGMVDQLLQFRKLEKGKWVVNPSGGEIFGFVRDAVGNLEPMWKEKRQCLELRLMQQSHLCSFDPSIVQQVLDNLVANAIKYSGRGSKITVEGQIESVGGYEEFVLSVEDEGVGIPLHEQENVLKPFYRIKRRGGEGGSGVGLALVNQLLSLCGGSIAIESPVCGKASGTRLLVRIPVDGYLETAEVADDCEEVRDDERESLLIIEDSEDFRKILAEALGRDFNVIEAVDGVSGLEKAKKLDPHIIVSDVMMPEMDGFEMCEKLKSDEETSHIPIILLTAKSSMEHRLEGIKLGADAYIAKPFDMNHLKARLNNLLESRRELKRKFARQLVVEPSEVTVTPADERTLVKAIKIVEENMRDPDFKVESFAEQMGMSRSTLKRKLKALTGQSPQPFIQNMRLKRAASLLKNDGVRVSEVAEMVGFYDLSYFGKVFKNEFGVAPSAYRDSVTGIV